MPANQTANIGFAAITALDGEVAHQTDIANGRPASRAKQANRIAFRIERGEVADGMPVAVKNGGEGVADPGVTSAVFVIADRLPAAVGGVEIRERAVIGIQNIVAVFYPPSVAVVVDVKVEVGDELVTA